MNEQRGPLSHANYVTSRYREHHDSWKVRSNKRTTQITECEMVLDLGKQTFERMIAGFGSNLLPWTKGFERRTCAALKGFVCSLEDVFFKIYIIISKQFQITI